MAFLASRCFASKEAAGNLLAEPGRLQDKKGRLERLSLKAAFMTTLLISLIARPNPRERNAPPFLSREERLASILFVIPRCLALSAA